MHFLSALVTLVLMVCLQLEPIELGFADFVQPMVRPNFAQAWQALEVRHLLAALQCVASPRLVV